MKREGAQRLPLRQTETRAFYRGDARRATEMTKTTLRITVQTERVLTMGVHRSLYGPCVECGDEVRMVTIEQTAALAGVTSLQIYHQIADGKLHFMETREGSLLVCFNSLNCSRLDGNREA